MKKTSRQLALARLRQSQLKHEEDIIAGRTVHKTITDETKRNGKEDAVSSSTITNIKGNGKKDGNTNRRNDSTDRDI